MAKIDLSKYGITGTTEIVYNPSYEVLFEEEKEGVFKGHTANYILVYCNDEKENLSNKIQEVECIQNLNDHILAKC